MRQRVGVEGFSMPNELDLSRCSEVESVPAKVSGAWIFRGTRVPVSSVLANLKDLSLDEVVAQYPSITRAQVERVLDFLAESADAPALVNSARSPR
jgi:uncharacterized protein (DUF433 family)